MREPFTKIGKDLLEKLNQYQIDGDLDRWSERVDHHKKSEKIVHWLREIDWMFFNNYFDWEIGGDGDNGETLMYQLDIIFDLIDQMEI